MGCLAVSPIYSWVGFFFSLVDVGRASGVHEPDSVHVCVVNYPMLKGGLCCSDTS